MLPNTSEVICGQCKKPFDGPLPHGEIQNFTKYSYFISVHERPTRCPHCDACHRPVLTHVNGAAFAWALVPPEPREGGEIIIPSTLSLAR